VEGEDDEEGREERSITTVVGGDGGGDGRGDGGSGVDFEEVCFLDFGDAGGEEEGEEGDVAGFSAFGVLVVFESLEESGGFLGDGDFGEVE
jgi:hypothetical protein